RVGADRSASYGCLEPSRHRRDPPPVRGTCCAPPAWFRAGGTTAEHGGDAGARSSARGARDPEVGARGQVRPSWVLTSPDWAAPPLQPAPPGDHSRVFVSVAARQGVVGVFGLSVGGGEL